MAKHKPPTRAQRLLAAEKALAKTLRRSGVDHLRSAGVKSQRPAFPDLTCEREGLAARGDRVSPNGYKRTKTIAVPDGFHIGNPHKQGLQLMPNREAEWSGGKKS